jgi:hypothetical protein
VTTICTELSAAQKVAVLGECVGSHELVDRFDRLFPGLHMGQHALRQAIVADDEVRTVPTWTDTHWIELVTARVPENARVIGKPLLESILLSELDQHSGAFSCARGLIAIHAPSAAAAAAAAAAPDAIPRDIAHLLYVLTCVHGWRYCHDPAFFEQLRLTDGTLRNYQRGLIVARLVQGRLRSHVLGKALKLACGVAGKNSVPKSHGIALPQATCKRLGIVA